MERSTVHDTETEMLELISTQVQSVWPRKKVVVDEDSGKLVTMFLDDDGEWKLWDDVWLTMIAELN